MKTRVLVVDDDHLVADTLSLIYNANGFESVATYNAAEGFARAQSFTPDLILCDVSLPDESGLHLADRVQAAMPQVRMLLLTAYASNEAGVSEQARRSGLPMTLLKKPCRPDDLLRISREMLA